MNARPNIPLSEQWHKAASQWVDAESAAQMLEETKSAVLSEMVGRLIKDDPKLSIAKAEVLVKGAPEWKRWLEGMVKARTAANRAKIERDYWRMRFSEWVAEDANHRAGARV